MTKEELRELIADMRAMGLEMALGYFLIGIAQIITIIGIPFGKMHFRLAKLALAPFGSEVV